MQKEDFGIPTHRKGHVLPPDDFAYGSAARSKRFEDSAAACLQWDGSRAQPKKVVQRKPEAAAQNHFVGESKKKVTRTSLQPKRAEPKGVSDLPSDHAFGKVSHDKHDMRGIISHDYAAKDEKNPSEKKAAAYKAAQRKSVPGAFRKPGQRLETKTSSSMYSSLQSDMKEQAEAFKMKQFKDVEGCISRYIPLHEPKPEDK
ncbi:hypothetical protein ADUPG1_013902 [Aduncisulcus paluster]|uniref:Uncharacterized protein n=1 Tax=Aduncisulcus paluster TaxID=2918883 RepID=A0ABQ5K6J7_9EUKA|nr:hypothetical protein ADUPG1_013902 [Aduncisulcus paluster]